MTRARILRAELCRELAWSAATDAGNRNARKHGRAVWNEEDFDAAGAEFERLSQYFPQVAAPAESH